ncbi:uncharacterized protein G2W53_021664 [Senna tora]|uniref:Uncharacterized protein n=1 Tax=Senna tora TaxID=362788 RepID=A0A834WHG0_9FABA|nr:uncharacterized protein G2W53_021664 [Senna tora]
MQKGESGMETCVGRCGEAGEWKKSSYELKDLPSRYIKGALGVVEFFWGVHYPLLPSKKLPLMALTGSGSMKYMFPLGACKEKSSKSRREKWMGFHEGES